MLRREYLRRLIESTHVEIYLSSIDGARLYWPWRMQIPKEARRKYRDSCEKYIIDSDFADPSVTNEDVLDTAYAVDAEVATLADVYQDMDATVDAVLKGAELADDHSFDGDLLIPLQQPYVECYESVKDCGTYFGLGGIKDEHFQKKLGLIRNFRNQIGPEPHLHGFGMGVSDGLAEAVQENPDLIDSIDYSTPIQNNIMGIDNGDERMSVVAARGAAQLVEDLRKVTPHVDMNPDPADLREEDQASLVGL